MQHVTESHPTGYTHVMVVPVSSPDVAVFALQSPAVEAAPTSACTVQSGQRLNDDDDDDDLFTAVMGT
jgi:hypothetical protein